MSRWRVTGQRNLDDEARILRDYYGTTADRYTEMHESNHDAHATALSMLSPLLHHLEVTSMLDVGTGTGRALEYLRHYRPTMTLMGVDPVQELLDKAADRGIPRTSLMMGVGEKLPFTDNSFDASCEFGILHHVPEPNLVVTEMTRVSRRCVFLSDSNRFGQGSFLARVVKLLSYKLGLWPLIDLAKTRGKGYSVSEGDGLAYSYSVFDSYAILASWATRIFLLPTEELTSRTWANPLLASGHVLVCALRD